MSSFAHLHVHSEFSLLDGLARLSDLCQRTAELGMDSLALTDHGQMYGIIQFHHATEKAGIKPIYGCEVYQAARRLNQRDVEHDRKSYHLLLLAQNMVGYQNLLQLVTTANLEGFYYRPRIDKELLAEHSEGLICLSACVSGEVPSLIQAGQLDQAREAVAWFKDVFGPERYYLELQSHEGVEDLPEINRHLCALAKEFDLRCVATNDVHYVKQSDASAHELLLAMQTNTTMADPDRMRMSGDDYYLTSPEEMAARFPECPEAIENSLRIAEQCNVDLSSDEYHLPQFDVPEPYTAQEYLRKLCEEGLERRYDEITPEIAERLEYELSVIHDMGFDEYFLINEDLVRWAKHEAGMLVGPGRGSGASSLVGYALGITDMEPLSLGLIFERFLNPGRITMPDIDLDYPEDRRQEVIDYLTERYGEDRTAQIATFGTLGARAAIRDVGRALDIPLDEIDHAAKLVPLGPKTTIKDGLKVPELRDLYETKSYIKKLIDYSQAVEGLSRHVSTHAAGVLISDKPLVEYTPLQRAPRGDGIISQFCMSDVEDIGLLKLDVLGLSTLTVLDRAFRMIEHTTGVHLDQASIPMDDPQTYALLTSGEVTGVFQVESAGMRQVLRDMQPQEFREIIAILGLYRPGPMAYIDEYIDRKFGRQPVSYPHPCLEPILKETYGIIVYQEQVIQIASELAGFTPAEADLMRRAMGKKKLKVLEQQRAKFIQGAIDNDIPRKVAVRVFEDIESFANYGFNKSHGAAYAVITVQTAYLKAHYPVEFMAALLSTERGNLDKAAKYVGECRRLGIRVRPPDVNLSDVDFRIEPAELNGYGQRDDVRQVETLAIRFGLGAIKNVGDGPAEAIVEARGDEPFVDIDDFVDRVDLRQVNSRVLECMIRAGVLDSLGERSALLASVDQMTAISQKVHRAREVGQRSLFDLNPDLIKQENGASFSLPTEVASMSQRQRLACEKELLGCYVSSHPLDVFSEYVDDRLTPVADIEPSMKDQRLKVAGVLDSVRRITTKKGNPMAFAQLEDLSGNVDLVLFPRVYEESRAVLDEERLKYVEAKVDVRDDEVNLLVDFVDDYQLPENARRRSARRKPKELVVKVSLDDDGKEKSVALANELLDLLQTTPGDTPYRFLLTAADGIVEIEFPEAATRYSPELEQRLASMVGQEHVTSRWS